MFIPPREIGDQTSRSAASLPPRPSRASISPAYAATLVHTPASTGTSVARVVRPSRRLRRARAASAAALNAIAPRPSTLRWRLARRSIFAPRGRGFCAPATGKKLRPRRAASLAGGSGGAVAQNPATAPATIFRRTGLRTLFSREPSADSDSLARDASANPEGWRNNTSVSHLLPPSSTRRLGKASIGHATSQESARRDVDNSSLTPAPPSCPLAPPAAVRDEECGAPVTLQVSEPSIGWSVGRRNHRFAVRTVGL